MYNKTETLRYGEQTAGGQRRAGGELGKRSEGD